MRYYLGRAKQFAVSLAMLMSTTGTDLNRVGAEPLTFFYPLSLATSNLWRFTLYYENSVYILIDIYYIS